MGPTRTDISSPKKPDPQCAGQGPTKILRKEDFFARTSPASQGEHRPAPQGGRTRKPAPVPLGPPRPCCAGKSAQPRPASPRARCCAAQALPAGSAALPLQPAHGGPENLLTILEKALQPIAARPGFARWKRFLDRRPACLSDFRASDSSFFEELMEFDNFIKVYPQDDSFGFALQS